MIKKEITQEQFELFSQDRNAINNKKNINHLNESLAITLRPDSLIIISISIILGLIFTFSLGVEKGKKINFNKITKSSVDEQIVEKKEIPISEHPAKIKSKVKPLEKEKTVTGRYAVQVATYKTNSHAEKEAQRLKREGYEAIVFPSGKYIVLCVGSFNDKNQAEIALKKLRSRYHDCLIRRL